MPTTRETLSRRQHGDYAQITTLDCEEAACASASRALPAALRSTSSQRMTSPCSSISWSSLNRPLPPPTPRRRPGSTRLIRATSA